MKKYECLTKVINLLIYRTFSSLVMNDAILCIDVVGLITLFSSSHESI